METRICRICKTKKDIDEFNFKNKAKGTHQRRCKECDKVFQKEWYTKNKSKRIKKVLERNTRVRKEHREYVNSIKAKGCVKCGYKKCLTAIDFHHLKSENKEMGIARATTQGWSIERLDKEISKCIVVCKNCHAEIHNE